jgi:alanyl-tRNA synthetase
LKIIDNDKIILDKTPFYAESGGQVGDRGVIEGGEDDVAPFRFVVHDTGKIGDMVIHYGEIEEGDLAYKPGKVTARVDERRRLDTAANHTATHLLHWALRQVLGQHATQQGSLVSPDYLRFDFTHPKQVTAGELQEIERLVNQRIQEDHEVIKKSDMKIEEAKRMGAMALFGEKYGETVRMIVIGDFSRELCGGTHLDRTGQAGCFRIQSESAVQSGVRRITALTRQRAVDESLRERSILQGLARKLSSPADALEAKIEALLGQVRDLRKEASAAGRASGDRGRIASGLLEKAVEVEGVRLLVHAEALDLDKDKVGELADLLRQSHAPLAGCLAGLHAGNVSVTIFASEELVKERGMSCGKALKTAAEKVGRRGGGRPDFAQTGWKEADQVDLALFMGVVREEFIKMLRK